jgi:NAD(P)-dependent dehydrogenase (short-subunit alcohol dehydrogenase family)
MVGGLDGRVVLVTGATRGIGRAAARQLASLGATTYLVGRDPGRTRDAVEEIRRAAGGRRVEGLVADLSSQAEVRRLAGEVRGRTDRLHVLLNNAGAYFGGRRVSADGLELTFALNHLSYFLLARLLLPLLGAGAPSRVVNVSSEAHRGARMDWDDLLAERSYSPWGAYGQSKLANVLFTRELARRVGRARVTANALHPGVVATHFAAEERGLAGAFFRLARPFLATPEKGARTPVHLASAPEVEGVTGRYFADLREREPSAAARDDAAAARLWEISERMTGLA